MTGTTSGAFTATIQPDLPPFSPTFEDVTISGNGAGLRFTNNWGTQWILQGAYGTESAFIDVTIANNSGTGLDLVGGLQASVNNVVIANNGTNCTDFIYIQVW